jgi:hypothetical protein
MCGVSGYAANAFKTVGGGVFAFLDQWSVARAWQECPLQYGKGEA